MKVVLTAGVVLGLVTGVVLGAGPVRLFEKGKVPPDRRLGPQRMLGDKYHPWKAPKSRKAWEAQAEKLREQMLVATGLWPMPPSPPLKPVIHGRIEREDYTIEKVYFASHPGHYVTGSLYRPKSVKGRVPGVLTPHGHWPNGRFYDAGEAKAKEQIGKGGEKFAAGGRYPLQARMVHLARMGCVVFHYDMVGYADSGPLDHRSGFGDVAAALRLQNMMGLQTFNSIRALDFLLSLDDVDPDRIGITGASGGGTQTFMLCAIDPRPDVAFPAVMVSTAMQGGCVCENCCYLRQNINNITIAALFAPRPMALSGADDWTIDIETRGLPELKQVYGLFGKADRVNAKGYPQFKHNYNQVAREMMYSWFNRYLDLGHDEPIAERDFKPVPPAELSVFDKQHPRPGDARTIEQYREYLAAESDRQFAELILRDKKGLERYRRVVGTAARVMLNPVEHTGITARVFGTGTYAGGVRYECGTLGRTDRGQAIPWVLLSPKKPNGTLVGWFDRDGKAGLFDDEGAPRPAIRKLLDAGMQVVSGDVFLTGELVPADRPVDRVPVNQRFLGYTYGYNTPPLASRVQDVLTVVSSLAAREEARTVHLVGSRGAGVWVLLAKAVSGGKRGRTIADLGGFRFETIERADDPMLLPGALKYGGIAGLAALAAPARVTVSGTGLSGSDCTPDPALQPLLSAYKASGNPGRLVFRDTVTFDQIAVSLLAD